jgi:hypothetical protein
VEAFRLLPRGRRAEDKETRADSRRDIGDDHRDAAFRARPDCRARETLVKGNLNLVRSSDPVSPTSKNCRSPSTTNATLSQCLQPLVGHSGLTARKSHSEDRARSFARLRAPRTVHPHAGALVSWTATARKPSCAHGRTSFEHVAARRAGRPPHRKSGVAPKPAFRDASRGVSHGDRALMGAFIKSLARIGRAVRGVP